MSNKTKTIISMLVKEEGITLFTIEGNMLEIKNNDVYDTVALFEYLIEKLTGTNTVNVDLEDYLQETFNITELNDNNDFEEEGRLTLQMINGKEVEGIFFAKKPQIAVRVGDEDIPIPNVENLSAHAKRAKEDDGPGIKAFLKRVASIIGTRKHSVDDLMEFIKGSELPITNDGRVIVYKKVNNTDKKGVYVDCHSKLITQRVGSRVMMPVDMVDPNSSTSCSKGLHVANLSYMSGFHGDTVIMCLVKPENFIAVPSYDKSKARVCEYDIIGTFTDKAFRMVSNSVSMEDCTTMEGLVQEAILGNIPDPIEEVHAGDKELIKIVPLVKGKPKKKITPKKRPSGKPLTKAKTKDKTEIVTKSRIVKKAKEAKALSGKLTIKEQAQGLYVKYKKGDLAAFDVLVDLKTSKKKGWKSFGFTDAEIQKIKAELTKR